MNIANFIELLDQLVTRQRTVIRLEKILAIGLPCLGLGVILLAHFLEALEDLKWFLTIGGTLVSTIVTYPLTDVPTRSERVVVLNFLKQKLEGMRSRVPPPSQQELKQVNDLLWKYLGKILGV